MSYRNFLKNMWYVTVLMTLGVAYFSFETGYLRFLWDADSSKLTFVIAAVFAYAYGRLGYILHRVEKITDHILDPGFESCDISMGLGMLGTVVGFIMMTTAFAGVDISDVQNIRQLFSISTQGMSTALYTTAAGLISSIYLRLSYYLTARFLK
jgi:hypothetical protein